MLETVKKYERSEAESFDYSIMIPSWNNLEYLKCCILSIRKNSTLNLQIIVFANEGTDGTLAWLKKQKDIDYLHSPKNVGVCYSLNLSRTLVKSQYMLYLNDDMYMYVLPNWDAELMIEVNRIGHKAFMLSSTMVEPKKSGSNCVLVKNYGDSPENFKEDKILTDHKDFQKSNWSGSTWPPNLMHRDTWDAIGGMSIEFSPGLHSDFDFSMKLHKAGVNILKGIGTSMVYHFQAKSTSRIKKNNGRKKFLLKWNITANQFKKEVLQMGSDYQPIGIAKISSSNSLVKKFKQILSIFKTD